jgi:Na+-transporting NADH:ubiquinone oxidoreductase subunit NqrB
MSDKPVFENLSGFTNEYTAWESFTGMIPGSVGETSTLACLIAADADIFEGFDGFAALDFFSGFDANAPIFIFEKILK